MRDLTQAGGVVVRRGADGSEVLVVTTRRAPGLWVLPKGHLEDDETPEETAMREVAEEAGVEGRIERFLGVSDFEFQGEEVRAAYYLMASVRDRRGDGGDDEECGIARGRTRLCFPHPVTYAR